MVFLNMFKNLPVISLVAEKWQVMASERTSTMRSPCDNHAITSRAEVVANWRQVNARQSHDKRATILRHSCHCQAMWCQAIRGRNMRCMHMLKLFAPPLFESPGSGIRSSFSVCDVHLVVYAMQSNHGKFFSSRCAHRDAQANIASCTDCIAARGGGGGHFHIEGVGDVPLARVWFCDHRD